MHQNTYIADVSKDYKLKFHTHSHRYTDILLSSRGSLCFLETELMFFTRVLFHSLTSSYDTTFSN